MTLFSLLTFLAENPPAPADGAASPGAGSGQLIFMLVLMVAFMYFGVIRPQKRQRQEMERKISSLRSGDKIVTAGGVHGIITNVKQSTVVVRIAENVRIELEKASVGTVLAKADEPEESSTGEESGNSQEKA